MHGMQGFSFSRDSVIIQNIKYKKPHEPFNIEKEGTQCGRLRKNNKIKITYKTNGTLQKHAYSNI